MSSGDECLEGSSLANLHESLIFIFSHTQFITRESTREIEMVTWFMKK